MFGEMLQNVRKKRPLIHSITNFVTVNDCANILLACGASPIMADDEREAAETVSYTHLDVYKRQAPISRFSKTNT